MRVRLPVGTRPTFEIAAPEITIRAHEPFASASIIVSALQAAVASDVSPNGLAGAIPRLMRSKVDAVIAHLPDR